MSPYLKIHDDSEHKLYLWVFSEDLSSLQEEFRNVYGNLQSVPEFRSETRKMEWLAVRIMLNDMLGQPQVIHYLREGCPYLENTDFNISISHAGRAVAIQLIKRFPAGIDIEERDDKIRRIAQKFVREDEIINTESELTDLYRIWCSKEVLFKIYQKGSVDFKRDLEVRGQEDYIQGFIRKDGKEQVYPLKMIEREALVLVYHKPQ